MKAIQQCCCGLDVHKKMVVACLLKVDEEGQVKKDTRTFTTMSADLLKLLDWLVAEGCKQVAMESTGVYWKPIYNLFEGQLEVMVVNAHHLKNVPGRKTDVKDAEWIAHLLQHGLLTASFIPPAPQRELRELTRYRTSLVEERARTTNRLQKVLEDTNFKLGSVVSDILGLSARRILESLLAGVSDPAELAGLAHASLHKKREQLEQALVGKLLDHHRFMLTQHLAHIDYLDELIDQLNAEIERRLGELETEIARFDQIPGVNRRVAEIALAEMGSDMSRFPSEKHLASWVGICPGNNESGGKKLSGKIRKGNQALRQALIQAAHGAGRSKDSFLGAMYRRLASRLGKKRAAVAVAHRILVIMYHILSDNEDYKELGADYYDERQREITQQRLVKRLERLGFAVTLQAKEMAA